MTEQVIVNPEVLQEVSQQFSRRAAVHQQNLDTIKSQLSTLHTQGQEGWIGDAANAHFSEMEQLVIPGYKRLIEVLYEATNVLKFTQNEFELADIEGSKPFQQLASTGNAQAEAAIKGTDSSQIGSVDSGSGGSGVGSGGEMGGGGSSGGGTPSSSGGGPSGGGSPSGGASPSEAGGAPADGGESAGNSGSAGQGNSSAAGSNASVRAGGGMTQADGGNNGIAGAATAVTAAIAGGKALSDKVKKT